MLITDKQSIATYYQALLERKKEYTGIFYAGVKTTSIFCISTCRARKPKPENVAFYTTVKSALDNGFRPCKICKPTENAAEAPQQILKALALVHAKPKEKIKDYELKAQQISPEKVRRWFKKNYGLTFHAYQRMFRINNAFQELKQGKQATSVAFDSGYESLSGFSYTYKKLIGHSPIQSSDKSILLIKRLTTPLGPMFICSTEKGICLLEFVDRKMLETEFKDLQKRLKANIILGENQHIIHAKKELKAYFEGKLQNFTVPLHTPGTAFQNLVWKQLLEIPFGNTSTYKDQAIKLGKANAPRAIARANGGNRIAIIIPCHRVIGADGSLRGYGGGLERKQWLLDHEKRHK